MKNKRWTNEEIKFLKKNYKSFGAKWCSEKLNRSVNAIQLMYAGKNKAKPNNKKISPKKWNTNDDNFLIKNYAIKGREWCSEQLNRSKTSITARAHKLRCVDCSTFWTEGEINLLKIHFHNKTNEQIMEIIPNKSVDAIQIKGSRIGLVRDSNWSDVDEQFLKDNYLKYGSKYCSEQLLRSASGVIHKSSNINLSTKRIGRGSKRKHPDCYNVHPEQFINIKTPEVAYVLGFIYADGHISNCKITLTCLKKDMDEIMPIINKTGNWSYRLIKKQKSTWQDAVTISTYNPFIYDFLVKNDFLIKSGASADKIINKIPDNLRKYFFLGFSDGDGCFYVNVNSRACQHTYSGCYNQDWSFIENILNKLSIKHSIFRYKTPSKQNSEKYRGCSYVSIRSFESLTKFGNFLYDEYENNGIGLKRKYDKFKQIKSLNKKNKSI